MSLDVDLESFFSTLTAILDTYFGATRISMAIPMDSTDIGGVPWAIKAVWNKSGLNEHTPNPGLEKTVSRDSVSRFSRYSASGNDEWYTDADEPSSLRTSSNGTSAALSPGLRPEEREKPVSPTTPSFRRKFSLTRKLSKSGLTRISSFSRSKKNGESDNQLKDDEPPPPLPPKDFPANRNLSRVSMPTLVSSTRLDITAKRMSDSKRYSISSTDGKRVSMSSSDFHMQHNSLPGINDAYSNLGSRPTSLYSSKPPSKDILVFEKYGSLSFENEPLIDVQGVGNVVETRKPVLLERKHYKFGEGYMDLEHCLYSPPLVPQQPSLNETRMGRSSTEEMQAAFTDNDFDDVDDDEDDEDEDTDMSVTELTRKFEQQLESEESKAPEPFPKDAASTSIVHIPLVVPTRTIGSDTSNTSDEDSGIVFETRPAATAPIAILSFMSQEFPYSTALLERLVELSPHLATLYMKASIHAGLSAQLTSVTKTYSIQNVSLGSRVLSRGSRLRTVPSTPEKRLSGETERSGDGGLSPSSTNSAKQKQTISRRHGRARSYPKLQSHGASFLLGGDPFDDQEFPTGPAMSNYYHWRRTSHGFERAVPSSRLLRTIIDAIPVQVYTMEPISGEVTWVSNRTLAYRGQSAEEFFQNPFDSIHPDEREDYIESWAECLRKGESLGVVVNVRRFDGRYRATLSRVVPLKDDKGVITHWLCSMMDVHKQRKAELEALRRARETASDHKYKILADATPIIVFTVHPQKGVVYANHTWFNYSGCSEKETYGFEYINRIHPEDRESFVSVLKSESQGPPPQTTEARLLDKNSEYNWHLVTYTKIDGSKDSTSLWFGTCTNINTQKQIQEKLQEAKDAAQRTIDSKTRFLSNMSHEIRTPLIGISGMVSFLLDTKLSEEQLDYCHTISSSSDALLMVINDILDLSKVESGKMTLTNSWFHVRRLVEEANEFLSSMAISKSLELNYIVESDVPIWVKGDRIRLRQVLLNVIGNAIKFTDQGEVFTRCSTFSEKDEDSGSDKIFLQVEVIDTGRGFTQEDEHRMFKPFSQLKSIGTPQHQTSGTGLGLVISRQLIQLHGGTLTCKGEKDKGSTFVFTFQVQVPSESDGPSPQDISKVSPAPELSTVGTDLDILIICPYKYAAMSIVHHIRKTVADPEKCRCTVAKSILKLSSEKLEKLPWTHVIINVIEIPESVQTVNQLISKAPVEIVLLTTPLQRPDILAQIKNPHGAKITFLYKPLKPSRYSLVFDPAKQREASHDLKMVIAQEVLQSHQTLFKSIGQFTSSTPSQPRVLLAEDNLVNQKVMSRFFAKAGLLCEIAADGEDCVSKMYTKGWGYYDLVLCDLDMPRKNGFETCREIREWESCISNGTGHDMTKASSQSSTESSQSLAVGKKKSRLPIVALSAYVMSEMVDKCKDAGFSRYMSKPVRFEKLKDLIVELLRDGDTCEGDFLSL